MTGVLMFRFHEPPRSAQPAQTASIICHLWRLPHHHRQPQPHGVAHTCDEHNVPNNKKGVPRPQSRPASTEQTQRSPCFEPAPRGRGWPETWSEIQKRRIGLPVVEVSGETCRLEEPPAGNYQPEARYVSGVKCGCRRSSFTVLCSPNCCWR